MKSLQQTPLSILDLVTYPEGRSIADAFRRTRDLAERAEDWNYLRFWMAEHHNLEGIASSATSVLIGHIAEHTRTLRVGSGGLMLPNHAPLSVAEQFGTLALLYPNRIDLGLGRAPGTDPLTARAFRRDPREFSELIEELVSFFEPSHPGQRVKAIPGAGIELPIWILGSSLYSAHLAARLGRPYAFAGHFAPKDMDEALATYRREFKPSRHLAAPHTMVGVAVVAAETDAKAEFLATSLQQRFLSLIQGHLKPTPPPVFSMEELWTPQEEAFVKAMTHTMIVGSPESVRLGLQKLIDQTQADELMITGDLFDDGERLKSFELIARAARSWPT